jgi:hypothetical protein
VSEFVLAVVIVSQEWVIGLFGKRASEVNRIMQFSDRKKRKVGRLSNFLTCDAEARKIPRLQR